MIDIAGRLLEINSELETEITRLREENARLREALKPFAGMVQYCEGVSDSESHCVFVGDLRAARAVIGGTDIGDGDEN